MKPLFLLFALLSLVPAAASTAQAGDEFVDYSLRRSAQKRTYGNERSERVRDLTVGKPIYFGSGCPRNSVDVSFSPDNLSFSILYNKFIANVDRSPQAKRDLKHCHVYLPMWLPQGMQLNVSRVDYRGFVVAPERGLASFHATYGFFPNARRNRSFARMDYVFKDQEVEDYFLTSDDLGDRAQVKSACGGFVYMYLGNGLQVLHGKKGGEGMITLDSTDGINEAKRKNRYYLNWSRCRPFWGYWYR